MSVETEREVDGRWIAVVPILPIAKSCGTTKEEPVPKVDATHYSCGRYAVLRLEK